jgi:thiol-disulfide isomerase/thioredoxin
MVRPATHFMSRPGRNLLNSKLKTGLIPTWVMQETSMSMTNHDGEERISPSLRHHFFAWSVAIVSSLSTSGLVTLSPSPAWAQEESSAAADERENNAARRADFDAQEFNQLLRTGKVDEAAAMLDAALEDSPVDPRYASFNISLAMGMSMTSREAAIERLQRQYQELLAVDVLDAQQSASLASTATALTSIMRSAEPEEKLTIIDEASAKLTVSNNATPSTLQSLALTKARVLLSADRADEAKRVLDMLVAAAAQNLNPAAPETRRDFLMLANNYSTILAREFPEAVAELEQIAEREAVAALEGETVALTDIQIYISLKSAMVRRMQASDTAAALEALDGLDRQLAAVKERLPEQEVRLMARFESQVEALRNQLEAVRKRDELLGTAAPPLDAAHYVAMDSETMDSLKGKVVLLDFWAVWCGPCIATFPHLIDWHERFADDGLVIIGVTRFYGYNWDQEAGRATRAEGVSAEEELAMLEQFRQAYNLRHGFIVTPEGSDYHAQFNVTGIPQAVLVDQEGKIRMIRVGSGEANAQALEAEIKSLLGS